MSYTTVAGRGQAEIIIRKSRFMANAAPATGEEAAWAFIETVRAEHAAATHNCFAFKAGSAQRMSDDGEPSGTAGRPIFDILEKQGLSDTVIVVTRYFGGILLGAGGLVRAYSQAAAAGVEAAGVTAAITAVNLRLRLDYSLLGKVQYLVQQCGALTMNTEYGGEICLDCRVRAEGEAELKSALAEASAGRILVERRGELLVGSDLRPLHGEYDN